MLSKLGTLEIGVHEHQQGGKRFHGRKHTHHAEDSSHARALPEEDE